MGYKQYKKPRKRPNKSDSNFYCTSNTTQSNNQINKQMNSQTNDEILEEISSEIGQQVNEEFANMKPETTNEETKEEVKKSTNENNSTIHYQTSRPIYISFRNRVIIYAILIFVFTFFSIFFISKILSKNEELITYQEKSNIDYKVYLKKNDFYETDYLGKDMVYVASLIRKIDIDFNYLFYISKESDIVFDYDVIGDLVISDDTGNNVFFEKEYDLLKDGSEQMEQAKEHQINKAISIDYNHFNDLANKFRSEYGVNTNSNLIVKFKIREKEASTNSYQMNNQNEMTITIPLSEKEVKIQMDYQDINTRNQFYTSNNSSLFHNSVYLILCIFSLAMMCVFVLQLLRLLLKSRIKETEYDKTINKILREYDRLIVETPTAPTTEGVKVIKIDSFTELLDVRDNLNLPIKYYVIAKHHKCNFYIDHGNELYLLILKSVDMKEDKDGKVI